MSLGSTYIRRDGRWESRLSLGSINGKRQSRSFYGSTREEAESKLISTVLGNASVFETEMTVRELCDEWLSVSSHRVKLSTLANYSMKIEKHIIPQFGDMMCGEITSKMAYGFMQEKLDNGLSARYIADIMVLLKTVYKYAQREYNIANPFDTIIMPKCTNDLSYDAMMNLSFFSDPVQEEHEHKMQKAVASIKNRFGKNSVLRYMSLQEKATGRIRNKLVGGHNSGES